MNMCQANGKPQEIQEALKDYFDRHVTLKFELAEEDSGGEPVPPKPVGLDSEARKELMNHPAVKTILMELDATVANITEQ